MSKTSRPILTIRRNSATELQELLQSSRVRSLNLVARLNPGYRDGFERPVRNALSGGIASWGQNKSCSKSYVAFSRSRYGQAAARPGLHQCSSGDCRFQFTVTMHTPPHSTKLPLRVWLKTMWLMLQSDKAFRRGTTFIPVDS
jgi:hypothetical protein